MSARAIAELREVEFDALSAGTAMARAKYHGLRRNAALALGASRRRTARPLLERLGQDESPIVREAARWALGRLGRGQ
jgi:epoxyqueuosine reductase